MIIIFFYSLTSWAICWRTELIGSSIFVWKVFWLFSQSCVRGLSYISEWQNSGFSISWLGLKLARCQSTANATIYWRTMHFLDFNEYSDMFKSSKKLFLDCRRSRILINAEEYICLKQFRINTVDPPLLNQQGSAHI